MAVQPIDPAAGGPVPEPPGGRSISPSDDDYRRLLEFRSGLRRFLRWSEHAAAEAGLNPSVHQLLLAIRGCAIVEGPRVSEVAQFLVVRHHTAVEVINRAERDGLVVRTPDPDDSRAVRVTLTPVGERRLEELTSQHIEELRCLRPAFAAIWKDLGDDWSEAP